MLIHQISNSYRFLFSCLLLATSLFAQTKAPPFYIIPDQNKVYIILASPPKEIDGFLVYRRDKTEKEFKLMTEPIMPINDPLIARDILGEAEYNWIAKALKVEDEFTFFRRLQDPGISGALSLVSLNVAKVIGKVFIDTLVRTGLEYTYRVAFLNYKEEEFSKIDERVVVQKHQGPAKRVGKISIAIVQKNIKLDWEYPKWQADKSDLVVGFNIYRKTDEEKDFKKLLPFPYLRTGEKLFYLDKNVEEGKNYEYYLTPVDLIGVEGPRSEIVTIKLKDITSPRPPLEVTAEPQEGKILIKWEPSLDEDVVSYNIYRSWSIHGQFTKLNPKPILKKDRTFIDNDVQTTGALYVYKVSAIDKTGLEGKQSTAAFGIPKDTTPPPLVSGLTTKVEKRMVSLNWVPQMTPDLDGYYVYRAEQKDNLFRLVSVPIKKDMPIFIDSGFAKKGLYPGRTYYYYVSPVDIALNEGKKSMIEVKIPDDEPPMAPASIYCKNNDDGTVEVSWQISLSVDLTKYRIHRQESGKEILLLKEVDINTNQYLDKTCEKGKKYFYFVSGVDSSGNQGEQLKFEIIPKDIMAPPAPKGLKVIYDKKRVNLTWVKVIADDLVGYNVYRSNLPTGVYEKLNKTILKTETFSDLDGRMDYYYRVSSFDTSSNESDKTLPMKPLLNEK